MSIIFRIPYVFLKRDCAPNDVLSTTGIFINFKDDYRNITGSAFIMCYNSNDVIICMLRKVEEFLLPLFLLETL